MLSPPPTELLVFIIIIKRRVDRTKTRFGSLFGKCYSSSIASLLNIPTTKKTSLCSIIRPGAAHRGYVSRKYVELALASRLNVGASVERIQCVSVRRELKAKDIIFTPPAELG